MGYYFELNEHPEIDQHESTDRSFLIISKSFFNQNNLPKDLNDQINGLLAQSNWAIQNPENSDERLKQRKPSRISSKIVKLFQIISVFKVSILMKRQDYITIAIDIIRRM